MQLFWYNCSLFCSFMERLALTFFFFSSLLISVSFSLHVPAIITFGDSIFDAGNNHFNKNCTAQADFPPYGSSFFHHPTGRFTNGRTVADFICEFIIYLYVYIYIHLHGLFAILIYFFTKSMTCSTIHRHWVTKAISRGTNCCDKWKQEGLSSKWHKFCKCWQWCTYGDK